MRGDQRDRAGRLVEFAGLDADKAVLDEVDAADALGARAAVHLLDRLQRGHVAAVDLDRHALLEFDDDLVFDRREVRVVGVRVAVLGGRVPRVLEEAGLNGATPHVLVDGERALLGLHDRQVVVVGVGDLHVTRQRQVANRADRLELGVDRLDGDLEAHLVVALAGAAVRDCVGAKLVCGAHQVLGDQRTRDRGDERVHAFVHGVRLEGLHAVFVRELVACVHDVRFDGAARERAFLDRLEAFAALADVERDGHHVFAGAVLEVRDGDGGVEAAGVREHNTVLIAHVLPFFRCDTRQYIQKCV